VLRHASPGDTIIVHHGTYHQNLTIRKSHITLIGRNVTLLPPATPRGLCPRLSAPEVNGICVLGRFDRSTFEPLAPTVGTRITGFRIRGFSGDGIFMYNVAFSRIVGNVAAHNAGYGIAGFVQHGGAYLWNSSHDNHEPGLYLGDSPNADYVIAHNRSWNNQYGIFVRHSAHGRIHDNQTWGNCVGAFLLDDGQPGGLNHMTLWDNRSWANDAACPADDEGAPPLSGIGVLLVGAHSVVLHDNVITKNVPSGPTARSGGLVMVSAKPFGGLRLRHNRVIDNTLRGNSPFDIFYDRSGGDNVFRGNTCNTSHPSWICS
jgi:nitrous oxidase accessory protein NosD